MNLSMQHPEGSLILKESPRRFSGLWGSNHFMSLADIPMGRAVERRVEKGLPLKSGNKRDAIIGMPIEETLKLPPALSLERADVLGVVE